MKLLVDIGNSRVKWALANTAIIKLGLPLPHNLPAFNQKLLAQWCTIAPHPAQLAISCVSHPERLQGIVSLARQLWPAITIVLAKADASMLGVCNAYPQPEKLGVDRWLALLAVRQITTQAACVIDCGTAITLDLIAADGQHLGGVISPGLTLMKRSLMKETEQLPFVDTAVKVGLADHTVAAIYSGTVYAAVGLIEKVLNVHATGFEVFLTGGDAAVIAAELTPAATLLEDLVLQGLLAFANALPAR